MARVSKKCSLLLIYCGVLLCGPIGYTTADSGPAAEQELSASTITQRFLAAYQASHWAEAKSWAEKLVNRIERDRGSNSPELVAPLYYLAMVELRLENWTDCLTMANRAIDILDRGPEPEIVQRLDLMVAASDADFALGNIAEAQSGLLKARDINKSYKPTNWLREAVIYDRLTEVAKASADRVNKGNRAAVKALEARESYFGVNSIQLLPGLNTIAGWYRTSNQLSKERKIHGRAIKLIEEFGGDQDIRLADQLRAVAETYTISNSSASKARSALDRAMLLDYSDSLEHTFARARVLTAMADYNAVFGESGSGEELYQQAWQLMSAHSGIGQTEADWFFSTPVQLYYATPSDPAKAISGKGGAYFTEGFVVAQFTVSRNGTLHEIEIVESRPREMNEEVFFEALGNARYRPRVIGGQIVETRGVRTRSTFYNSRN
jgi:tetratricopeptide (TPR) repeat protein